MTWPEALPTLDDSKECWDEFTDALEALVQLLETHLIWYNHERDPNVQQPNEYVSNWPSRKPSHHSVYGCIELVHKHLDTYILFLEDELQLSGRKKNKDEVKDQDEIVDHPETVTQMDAATAAITELHKCKTALNKCEMSKAMEYMETAVIYWNCKGVLPYVTQDDE